MSTTTGQTAQAPAAVSVGQRVYIVSVSHRHGVDAWACATEEGVQASIADYCRQWWGDEHGTWPTREDDDGDEVPVEAPEDDEECIAAYFEAMRESEDYEVREGVLRL